MIYQILTLILTTLIPTLELRASIPLGILTFNLHWLPVFAITVFTNIILGLIVYIILDNFIHILMDIKIFQRYYSRVVEKTQKKIKPGVEKYGLLAIALFIAIPLPGSGSYTGALAAHLLGLNKKKFFLANTIGVIIAGILVTLATLVAKGLITGF